MERARGTPSDLSGFLDGYQARNMAMIERGVALPLSEIQTRLKQMQVESLQASDDQIKALGPRFAEAEDDLRSGHETVVSKLTSTSERLNTIWIERSAAITEDASLFEHFRRVVRLLLETAEISRIQKLEESTIRLAEAIAERARK
jgi:hypothetical protein